MEEQSVTKIELTKDELLELSNKNLKVIIEACNAMLQNENKDKTALGIEFEDELGIKNEGFIVRRKDNDTIFSFGSTNGNREEKRQVDIWLRQKVTSSLSPESTKVKYFEITYRNREGYIVGVNKVEYCPDGRTVSYAKYWHNDNEKKVYKSAHFEKGYERESIQGILEKRIESYTHDKRVLKSH